MSSEPAVVQPAPPPRAEVLSKRAHRAPRRRHPLRRRRRIRLLALRVDRARDEGLRHLHPPARRGARPGRAAAPALSHRAGVSALAGEGLVRRGLHGSHLQLREWRRDGGRRLVHACAGGRRARHARAAAAGGRDDLVEGVRNGARAIGRRRRRAPAPEVLGQHRLGPAHRAVRAAVARALRAPRALRVRLPVGTARACRRAWCASSGRASRASSRRTLPSACATARSSRASST